MATPTWTSPPWRTPTAGIRTINGAPGDLSVPAAPGQRARIRVINTDNAPMEVWAGALRIEVVAIDGSDVNAPDRR